MHDVGVGAIVGGNLFARVGMHPALREVSDPRQRGSVTNTAWRRYGTVNGLGLAAILTGWAGLGSTRRALACCRRASAGLRSPRTSPSGR